MRSGTAHEFFREVNRVLVGGEPPAEWGYISLAGNRVIRQLRAHARRGTGALSLNFNAFYFDALVRGVLRL